MSEHLRKRLEKIEKQLSDNTISCIHCGFDEAEENTLYVPISDNSHPITVPCPECGRWPTQIYYDPKNRPFEFPKLDYVIKFKSDDPPIEFED